MRKGVIILALGACVVSACSLGAAPRNVSNAASGPSGSTSTGFRAPVVQRERGLESVIGKGASTLTQRFGNARLDLIEGDARKLQFSSESCVLDIFLYPLQDNADPVATHIEARQRVGGASTDHADCIADIAGAGSGD